MAPPAQAMFWSNFRSSAWRGDSAWIVHMKPVTPELSIDSAA